MIEVIPVYNPIYFFVYVQNQWEKYWVDLATHCGDDIWTNDYIHCMNGDDELLCIIMPSLCSLQQPSTFTT